MRAGLGKYAVRVWAVTGHTDAACCPDCGTLAGQVHERVVTRPRDLRRGLDAVNVCWVKRRWKCANPGCLRLTFTEALPEVPPRCRLTGRLAERAVRSRARPAGKACPGRLPTPRSPLRRTRCWRRRCGGGAPGHRRAPARPAALHQVAAAQQPAGQDPEPGVLARTRRRRPQTASVRWSFKVTSFDSDRMPDPHQARIRLALHRPHRSAVPVRVPNRLVITASDRGSSLHGASQRPPFLAT